MNLGSGSDELPRPLRRDYGVVWLFAFCVLAWFGLAFADSATAGWLALGTARRLGNFEFASAWHPLAGVDLQVVEGAGGQVVTFSLKGRQAKATFLPAAGAKAQPLANVRVFPENFPGRIIPSAQVLLKFRTHFWSVYVDGRLVLTLPPPFTPPAEIRIAAPPLETVQPRFQPVEPVRLRADFMIPENAPNELHPWQPLAGEWGIHTVKEDVIEQAGNNIKRVQQRPPDPESSPNFYSLRGRGPDGLIVTGHDFFDYHDYAAAVHLDQRGEGGLAFRCLSGDEYYAFTLKLEPELHEGRLELWRQHGGRREVLAQAATELLPEQWYQPKVRVTAGRIRCYLDNMPVFDQAVPDLPPGGMIGLYAGGLDQIRFDDVKLDTVGEIDLETVGGIRFHTLLQRGAFYHDGSFLRAATADSATFLKPPRAKTEQLLLLGSAADSGVVFSAEFTLDGGRGEVGLVSASGADGAGLRFLYGLRNGVETFSLARGAAGPETWSRSVRQPAPARVELLADASEPGLVRFYKDGEMVFFAPLGATGAKAAGAAGIIVGPDTEARVAGLRYRFDRDELFRELPQPVDKYLNDPFMRHWSSPEGQWFTEHKEAQAQAAAQIWHKGDFFSRFEISLPMVEGGLLEVGIPDGDNARPAAAVEVAKGRLVLRCLPVSGAAEEVQEYAFAQTGAPPPISFTLHADGCWLWLDAGNGVPLLRQRFGRGLGGSRVRVKGYTLENLSQSLVTRYNVKDEMFNESPHEWLRQGGKWQIINRFQCQPVWSHMVGEAADGVAALWHKYSYRSDLSMEFYAGIRHGWYDTAGDINCTIFADALSPAAGYSVTCTERDQNISQNWTRLRRQGQVLASSDAYLIPRQREGHRRIYDDPLLDTGRPIHGAWYFIKLRRRGQRLEYYFDNQLVFAATDPKPLGEGMAAIWTFMNSMTVARVKIAFQEAKPRQFAIRILPLSATPPAAAALPSRPIDGLAGGGFPLNPLAPQFWECVEDAGFPRLSFAVADNTVRMRLENRLGAGSMAALAHLPPLPYDELAGFSFDLRRTADAPVNFHYSLGSMNRNGEFVPEQRFFHHLGGDDFTLGDFLRSGATAVAGGSAVGAMGGWQRVTAWLPSAYRPAFGGKDPARLVRLDGFGNLQESRMNSGLAGAGADAAFEVRNLAPVWFSPPKLRHLDGASRPDGGMAVSATPDGAGRKRFRTVDEAEAFLTQLREPRLRQFWLSLDDGTGAQPLCWVTLPEKPRFGLSWSASAQGQAELRNLSPFPDPRLAGAALSCAGTAVRLEPRPPEDVWMASLPRDANIVPGQPVLFDLECAGQKTRHELKLPDSGLPGVPVLLSLGELLPFFENFESADAEKQMSASAAARLSLLAGDETQGRFLRIRNRKLKDRLQHSLKLKASLASHPLLQFRCRAGEMARFTVSFGRTMIRVNEAAGLPVRCALPVPENDAWNTWCGFVSDAFLEEDFNLQRLRVSSLDFGSRGKEDMSGRYSQLHLDDLVLGPAVGPHRPLRLIPEYHDFNGVAQVFYAVLGGEMPYHSRPEPEQKAAVWHGLAPGQPVEPLLDGLADGVHHLLLKAANRPGRESAVTDLPFLLDRQAPALSHKFQPMRETLGNGVLLRISAETAGGAPWMVEDAAFKLDGRKLEVPSLGNKYVRSEKSDSLLLNYPLFLRRELDAAKDGDTLELTVENIADGAGNTALPYNIPIRIRYDQDKRGPAWEKLVFGPQVFWFRNWEGEQNADIGLQPAKANNTTVQRPLNAPPFLQTQPARDNGSLTCSASYRMAEFPWLSFRLKWPDFGPKTKTEMLLQIQTNVGTYDIALANPSDNARRKAFEAGRQIDWSRDEWQSFDLNLPELLRNNGVAEKQIAKAQVRRFSFVRREAKNNERLWLADLFIHRVPAPDMPDSFEWTAYDQSGLAAIELVCLAPDGRELWKETLPSRQVDLRPLRSRGVSGAWLRCRSLDKAGNPSTPVMLPLPPPLIQ